MESEMNMSWIEWLNSNHGLISAAATVVIAVFAIITAWLTKALANENRLMRKSGTEPKVVTYLVTVTEWNPRTGPVGAIRRCGREGAERGHGFILARK